MLQIFYAKNKYEFLEKLYWQFTYNFLACVHTLYWEKVTHNDLLVLSKFISGGEDNLVGKNPNSSLDLQVEFFGNERRSRLSLTKCMELAIQMNRPFLSELRKYADLEYPVVLDMSNILPSVKDGKSKDGNKKKKNKHK